jgi:SAM-dependent methyltransferase
MYCSGCGFIWNDRFDASRIEYSKRYDNSLDYSPVFQIYAQGLARRLINTYGIRKSRVVEIGCGKGHFLNLICEEGDNHGVGFDPSYEGDRVQGLAAGRITYYQDFYGAKYTGNSGALVCCRHVVEHIGAVLEFLSMVRQTIARTPSTIVYFEVPDVRFILEKLSIWDIIYEHCNYFSRESLGNIFKRCGFDILRLEQTYGGQFLSIDARLARNDDAVRQFNSDLLDLGALVAQFATQARERLETWQGRIDAFRQRKKRAVVWGGGSKAVTFLNLFKAGDAIPYVVDINPHKQDRFVGGTGQRVVSPEFLMEYQPDVIILMNPIYRSEVVARANAMNLTAEILDA